MPAMFLLLLGLLSAGAPVQSPDRVTELVAALDRAVSSGDRAAIRALGQDNEVLADLAITLTMPPPQRVVLKERDRSRVEDKGYRLLIEVFWERGLEGRVSTWSLEAEESDGAWRFTKVARLAHVSGLYRLSLNPAKQFAVRDLHVEGPDLVLHVKAGQMFVAETPEGVTGIVLLGAGEARFTPPDQAERTQLRIFSGAEALNEPFTAAFVRVRPEDFRAVLRAGSIEEQTPRPRDLGRAREVFDEYVGRTLQLNLMDLSSDRWSITPQPGDIIAEIRTRRFGTLTYTKSNQDPEDITLFDRRRRRNISVYASPAKLERRGRFYSEDDRVDYDVLAYDVDVSVSPERGQIEGTTRLKVLIRGDSASSLNLRLAEGLVVRGVFSPGHGRLLHLRIVNQNSLIVSLPGTLLRGTELWLSVSYAGVLPPQELEREAVAVSQQEQLETLAVPPEARYLYSNRTYWYPQSIVTDYATGTLRVTVPEGFDVVASGRRIGPPAPPPGVADGGPKRLSIFEAERPVRYLAFAISRFRDLGSTEYRAETDNGETAINVLSNARQVSRARGLTPRAAQIFGFYASLLGDAPYPGFTVAFTERELPGGHSPAYFAIVDQPQRGILTWRNDPVNFDNFPLFFLAHEIAHQWWGQAIGWKNYHEQWLSEGFAQYFAALYAEKHLEPNVMGTVLRQMRQTAVSQSDKGPVYLGYRLGHVQGDPRIFRSIVYNKGAMVLHMLRRIVGDEAFFRGVRAFYAEFRYQKAGTGDLIDAMEKASGRELDRFFDQWIFGSDLPEARLHHQTEGSRLTLRLEQSAAFEFPLTVRITYRSGRTQDVLMVATGPRTEQTIEVPEPVRSVIANPDHGTLAVIR
jgi:hypothetical protein